MTATEELRRMLDERGVEWENGKSYGAKAVTRFKVNGVWLRYVDYEDYQWLDYHEDEPLTAEQAIEATLGREPYDDEEMDRLHDRMNAALFEYERAQGIEQCDGDEAIVVPFVVKMHSLLEAAATLGRGTCHANETETWQGVCMSKPIRYVRNLTIHVMECSACGRTFEHVNGPYEYCPHCRARITEVTDG